MPTETSIDKQSISEGPTDLAHPKTIFDFVIYRLHLPYAIMSTHVTGIYEGVHGITRQEWYVMALLAAIGGTSPTALAEASGMNLPLTSKTLRSLLDKKLVRRELHAADRRCAIVTLTASGRKMYEAVYRDAAAYNQAAVANLSDRERVQLASLLDKLYRGTLDLETADSHVGAINRRGGGSRTRWDR
ncbi:MarR family winged helix-turn-helix transcriptional regulator [Burkholderia cepacia]|uniref:MarR family winged helix-turn-helix transcriptional regulator n=1 Tax=Burkholderia cepacia TaxID=292 RepID=UPI001CF4085C|nr:MarR family transcriptional regulator [Burkholderia cepacia]MCA8030986.1 MarR family transcriptional regulator [Burkholderia cepacia]